MVKAQGLNWRPSNKFYDSGWAIHRDITVTAIIRHAAGIYAACVVVVAGKSSGAGELGPSDGNSTM